MCICTELQENYRDSLTNIKSLNFLQLELYNLYNNDYNNNNYNIYIYIYNW